MKALQSFRRAKPDRKRSPGAAKYLDAIRAVEETIRQEMTEWNIRGVAVALVDDEGVIYTAGFGEAKRDSLFRVGSISKLFTAIAVMQQVEAGKLNLDEPVAAELLPVNPFPGEPAVTLRQLLCHRSGLQREAAIGGYFDGSQPGLAATIRSLRGCVLVTKPGEKTRYSNVGSSLAGYLVERVTGMDFEDYQREFLLEPLGMNDSAWTLASASRRRIVKSHLRVADGEGGWTRRTSPFFDLGTIPAGNLFSSAGDLARFASALLAEGGGLVIPGTLQEMWRPQLTMEDTGYGLGFVAGRFRGRRAIGHNGAVYGYSSSFVVLPGEKLGVIVLGNEDIANGRMHRISDAALSSLLEARRVEWAPSPPEIYSRPDLDRFAGSYESQSYWARIDSVRGRLMGEISGQPTRFVRKDGLTFAAHSRIEDATTVVFEQGGAGRVTGFRMGAQHFERVPNKWQPIPREWYGYLGSYGPDYIPVEVSERHGHLYAMTENMLDYRLTPLNRQVFLLPPGMYADEHLVFLTGPDGRAERVNFANMILPRRKL